MQELGQETFVVEFILRVQYKDYGIGGRKLWHMYTREFKGNAPLGGDRFEAVIDKSGLKIRAKNVFLKPQIQGTDCLFTRI